LKDISVLLDTPYGQVIAAKHDVNQTGHLVQHKEAWSHRDIVMLTDLAQQCGEGAVCVDIGANLGLFSLAWGRALEELGGKVICMEGQRVLAYMICGSVILNNLENVHVHNVCVGGEMGQIPIPQYDYSRSANFGSVEFRHSAADTGQDRQPDRPDEVVPLVTLDSLNLSRVDIIKIDAEGMEEEILRGGEATLKAHHPVMFIEWIKSDRPSLIATLKRMGYVVYDHGYDIMCFPYDRFPEFQLTLGDPL
jgi:FkbM family methyltransferase